MQDIALTVGLIIKFLDASYSNNPETKIDDYELVTEKEYSDFKSLCENMTSPEKQFVKVYYNKKLPHCVVVHRGTEKNDETEPFQCLLKKNAECKYRKTRRYIVSETIQKWAENKWEAKNVTTLGHSQGGLLAALVGQNSKEIIKIQPLHRLNYEDTSKEITIRSMNDFVDSRKVDPKKINKSDPSKHMYIWVNESQTFENNVKNLIFYELSGIKIDVNEHSYRKVLSKIDENMRIGKCAHLLEPGPGPGPGRIVTLIKQIGIGVVVMGSVYLGYKWLNKKSSKNKGKSLRKSSLRKSSLRKSSSRMRRWSTNM
jgi:hypothetical protein